MPDERRSGSRALSILRAIFFGGLTWCIRLFVALILFAFYYSIVPTYIEYFEIHEMPLPGVTLLTLQISLHVVYYWYLPAAILLFADSPVAIGLQFLPDRLRWIRVCWFDGYLLAAILLLMIGSMGLYAPFRERVESYSGAPSNASDFDVSTPVH